MKKLYRIKNWDENFENHDSRKLKKCSFVCVPNKQDGKGYRRLAKHKNSVGIFCGWSLMLQIASKLPERGLLADEDGALSAIDLSDMSGFPVEVFDRALSVLSDPNEGIEWIEIVSEENGVKTGDSPATSRNLPPSPDITGRREGKGMEQKEVEEKDWSAVLPFKSDKFLTTWKQWTEHRKETKKALTPQSIQMQFMKFKEWGEERSIKAIEHSIRGGYQGIFEEKSSTFSPQKSMPMSSVKLQEEIHGKLL